ncbi:Spy/CpxP family protein refolding chaperone [Herbaspirillum sp. SJZ107]|uniref:Spy/CpxP family protein refolding chaperone n=1 Tax=Herbaspirillum sp. SJZ107 TaxID=2572881 RepID=UPI0011531B31|nr:Spy/CpxP family protein refolding chaperone [Herbaspirillum sp. SJZ107]TQK11278.1 Spy/CpxP family protein refolding chaperone [Herbaspirillum sp. SJZ107]
MTFSRRFTRHSAAALLVACFAATGTNPALAGGQADAQAGAGPVADAPSQGPRGGRAPGEGAQPGFADQSFGEHSFGKSRPGAPGLDGPTPAGPPHDDPLHGPGGFGLFGRLHRLHLSEAQQDQLFAIMHAAAPRQRMQAKAERKAHEALRTLGAAPQFDEARANAAARELGQAVADGALLRARLESQVLAVLTPEQRQQLRRERPPGPPDRP